MSKTQPTANSPFIDELRATVIGYGASAATVDALIMEVRRSECAATTRALRAELGRDLHRLLDALEGDRQADFAAQAAA